MTRTTRTLSALALGATVFAGLQGTAAAQTREHILLARQTQVPSSATVELRAPGRDPSAAVFIAFDSIAGEDGDGGGGGGGGEQDCYDWTDAETGKPMSNC